MPVRRGARFRSRLPVRPTRPELFYRESKSTINEGPGFAPGKAGITGPVNDSRVITVESIDKSFPPALSGWRALLQPVAKAHGNGSIGRFIQCAARVKRLR